MTPDIPLGNFIDAKLLRPISRAFVVSVFWLITRWDYVLAAACFLTAGAYLLYLVFVTHQIFWDVNFYAAAVKTMAAGVSPYDDAYLLKILGIPFSSGFTYPPLVAEAFYKFSWLVLTPAGRTLLITAYAISWLSIPYLLAGSPNYWYSRKLLYVWGLYLVLFGLAGMRLLVVGNISAILFAFTVLSIVVAIRTRDYKSFWVAILVCSFIKPYFLAFLLFPVILDKKYISSVAIIFVLLALHGFSYLINPQLFLEYVKAFAVQPSSLGNIGFSIYTLVAEIFAEALGPNTSRVTSLSLGVHFIFSITILMLAYAINARRVRPQRFDLFCCWLFVSAFLISPRNFDYDLAVVVVPIVLLARMILIEGRLGIVVAAITAAFSTILLRTPALFHTVLSEWSSTFIMLGVWFGAAVHFLTSTRSNTEEELSDLSFVHSEGRHNL
jgi:hypothetical protein